MRKGQRKKKVQDISTTLRVQPTLLAELDSVSDIMDTSRADVIRLALVEGCRVLRERYANLLSEE